MNTKLLHQAAGAITVSVRPARQRSGTRHTYVLNGVELHDVLIGGKWVTTSVKASATQH